MYTTPMGLYEQVKQNQLEMEREAQQDLELLMANNGSAATLPVLAHVRSLLSSLVVHIKLGIRSGARAAGQAGAK